MDSQSIYDKLSELTEGLLYISETESEFSVYELDVEDAGPLVEDISGTSAATARNENYTVFFERVLDSLDTEDPVLQDLRSKYSTLFVFLQQTFERIDVLRTDGVEQHIFIIGYIGKEQFILHTTAIES